MGEWLDNDATLISWNTNHHEKRLRSSLCTGIQSFLIHIKTKKQIIEQNSELPFVYIKDGGGVLHKSPCVFLQGKGGEEVSDPEAGGGETGWLEHVGGRETSQYITVYLLTYELCKCTTCFNSKINKLHFESLK